MINWNELRKGYNRIYKTNYHSVKSFLSGIYIQTPNLKKISKILGVSHPSIRTEMVRLNIPRLPKGHRGDPKALKAIKAIENISELTCRKIATQTGYCWGYVWFILNKYQIKHVTRNLKKKDNGKEKL